MSLLNLYRAPKPKVDGKGMSFIKQVLMIILSTTISLSLTLTAIALVERHHRAKDRRLTALMVMSNIESFAQQMDSVFVQTAEADSAITWLTSKPLSVLEQMPNDKLIELLHKAHYKQEFNYDRSAEKIFSNSIDTWKNMGNFQFIDNVGLCFSKMEFWSKILNDYIAELNTDMQNVTNHPDQYPGSTLSVKKLRDTKVRTMLRRLHNYRRWLHDSSEELRYLNRKNMAAIGISEEELMDFIEKRQREIVIEENAPSPSDFVFPTLKSDDLPTFGEYDAIVDSIHSLRSADKNPHPTLLKK